MNSELNKAYSEVCYILKFLGNKYINKLPKKLLSLFEDNKNPKYIPNIKPNIPLEEQELLPDTINILAMLKLDYWCKNENEKEELVKLLTENEKKYQEEIHKKYDTDNIFKNKDNSKQTKQVIEKNLTIIPEEKWYNKIIKKLKSIFRLNKYY